LNPGAALAHLTLGKVLIAKGQPQQALAEVENETLEWGKLTGEVLVFHALDREQDSNAALAALIAKYGTDGAFQIAQSYSFRGETDKAFGWLERAYEQRDAGLPEMKTDTPFHVTVQRPSVITLKPANESGRDRILLLRRFLWRQVSFCVPTARTAFEHMPVM